MRTSADPTTPARRASTFITLLTGTLLLVAVGLTGCGQTPEDRCGDAT